MNLLIGALAVIGILLLALAGVGFMLGKPAGLDGSFLGVGAGLLIVAVVIAVFHHRMEGKQEITLGGGTKISINLAKLQKGEGEIKAGKLTKVSEVEKQQLSEKKNEAK